MKDESLKAEVIGVQKLSFGYDRAVILRDISFSVRSGDFVAIIGSNGTGKSTLLKLLLGFLVPSSGEIRILGAEPSQFKDWPKIGYVAQNGAAAGSSFPATALEIVKAGLYSQIGFLNFPKRENTKQALEALDQVGLRPQARKLFGSLSGGQQQRVMLARVLAGRPRILLLDEPTTGIDSNAAQSLYELLQRLNRETGITIVMVTHDVERASGYAGRMLSLGREGILEIRNGGNIH